MTRNEAVKIWRVFGSRRIEAHLREGFPQHVVDRAVDEDAEDVIDGLTALGILSVEPSSPQATDASQDRPDVSIS